MTSPGSRLVLATRNGHKVAELRRILADAGTGRAGLAVVGMEAFPEMPDVAETGVTFAENALLKAHAVARATGLPAVADDSGLCVAVLGGSPGVFSARWSGRHGDDRANLELLLAQLSDVPDVHRRAWFACAAALALPGGAEHVVHGRLDGVVVRAARGSGGFGYDPIFMPEGDGRTLAEYPPAEKDAISHRGRAFRALAPVVLRALATPPPADAPPATPSPAVRPR
jgi:XTP/dITP diphosphohydrolase